MINIPAIHAEKWPSKAGHYLISAASFIVFAFLDLLDVLLCIPFRVIDGFMEQDTITCYCHNNKEKQGKWVVSDGDGEAELVSESLYQRKNIYRNLVALLKLMNTREFPRRESGLIWKTRWSDCSCESCVSWQKDGGQSLHVVVKEPSQETKECRDMAIENVIFLPGFLSSSSFWTETVFPNLSINGEQKYRLFALDLLGFGTSPKPWDCMYTLNDHVKMVEKSLIGPFDLSSFHIVAHSMGCIIALAFAAKFMKSVKSVTLIAPPYFPSSEGKESLTALNRLAQRRLWPPLLFGSAVMSWYEHLGRSVCFIICRNHRIWEWTLKLITRKRNLIVEDITRHTHHSAWHSMHNVICGGAKLMDKYLEAVKESGVLLAIIQGDKDQLVPLECSHNMKLKVPMAELQIISNANHATVVFGREKHFTRSLEHIWRRAAEKTISG